jgi:RNA polymerase sigma-70 factor (ECF subfamily)
MATMHPSKEMRQAIRDSDAQLMSMVQARKPWALEALFNRYVARGIRRAQHVGLDYQTAEDVVTDAFIKIWNQAEKFQAMRGSFSGWFYTIVHNLAIDEIRRLQTRSNAQVQSYIQSSGFAGGDAENQFMHEIERIQVRAALKELPEPQRDLLQLAYVEGLSRREIAKRLALPLGTVHTRVRLGKEKLKRLLQEPKLRQEPNLDSVKLNPWASPS